MGSISTSPAGLKGLDSDALKVALQAAETLMTFRAFTAPGGMFVMLPRAVPRRRARSP